MSSNIYNLSDYKVIVNRITKLCPDSQRQWGNMDVNQMLEHCSIQLKLGLGIIQHTGNEGSPIMRTSMGIWLFLFVLPWMRGMPTPSKMNMLENCAPVDDFKSEQESLLELLEIVQGRMKLEPHPFFGPLDKKRWGRLIWKHLDHHLKQFGC
ncbi:DUF1569 domain-containing protein [Flagellimonas sp. CMM7]|uniref:DUF1569 domain-containing protein n=1 Tax=Flagellimonas sp. CMM7 TaxID=2654676 RepID=UPI0013D8D25A|nr:DUF1569 domain-containing protein [Flagellimonas sp. CMM7]UII78781.1 DUF1569 domain-containing protein [Flagellimonas sp. CMM7]